MLKLISYIYFFFFIFLSNSPSLSQENKILFKVNNQIITTQDISNEIKYLGLYNQNLYSLDKEQIFEISKNSIIKRKIKQLELSNKFPDIEINQKNVERILSQTYLKLGYKNLNEFKNLLNNNKLDLEVFKENLITNSLWNEFISVKFRDKIRIDEKKLILELKEKNTKQKYLYLLSEIVFTSNKKELDRITNDINSSIKINGFENTALKYSISNSANLGGKIGWIQENALSQFIINQIRNLKKGEHSNPINIPSGFLILKIEDIKIEKKEINFEKELKKLITIKKNEQLNQFSNLYFNKIKKEYQIDEL